MEPTTHFYAARIKTGLLAIIMMVTIYIIYTKLLVDPYGLTETAKVVLWGTVVIAAILGVVCFIKAVDPRPIVTISPEGLTIRTFIFLEDFVPWEEVIDIGQEQYTNRTINPVGYVKVTANIMRIYRPSQRSLAINLTMLNTRGHRFNEALAQYISDSQESLENV